MYTWSRRLRLQVFPGILVFSPVHTPKVYLLVLLTTVSRGLTWSSYSSSCSWSWHWTLYPYGLGVFLNSLLYSSSQSARLNPRSSFLYWLRHSTLYPNNSMYYYYYGCIWWFPKLHILVSLGNWPNIIIGKTVTIKRIIHRLVHKLGFLESRVRELVNTISLS